MSEIEWRVIPSFPKYMVSSDGQVRHKDVARIRMLHDLKLANQYELADWFKISQAQINNIVLGKQRQRPAIEEAA